MSGQVGILMVNVKHWNGELPCSFHRAHAHLTLWAAPELDKQGNREYTSMFSIVAIWAMQVLVLGGPGTWTPAHTVERRAA